MLLLLVAAIQLASSDTAVTIKANQRGPQLVKLALWNNRSSEKLIDHVEVGGVITPIVWDYESTYLSTKRDLVRFVYTSRTPHLRLEWEWNVRSSNGPLEHTIRIQNLGDTEIWLPLQDSFEFDLQVDPAMSMNRFWVEKGASLPSEEGTHLIAMKGGDEWTGTSSTYAHPKKNEPREMIPYALFERDDLEQSGWYVGIEFSGRTRITARRQGDSIAGAAGLNPNPGLYRTRLLPGETFETPPIFVGAFKGGPDGAGNILRRWIRETLSNPVTRRNPEYPMLVSNSWGSGMAINAQQAHRMMQDARGLGFEMFHLDAGWFRGLGDWVPDPVKFPDGIASLSTYAHGLGLRFGLWTDWTQAGISNQPGALNVNDAKVRDWLTVTPPKDWHPAEFKGITIDIGLPAARQWALAMLTKLVGDFHLDMLEHDGYLVAQGCERPDHPHAPLDPLTARHYKDEDFLWVEGSNDTDVSYYSTRAYYQVQTSLRQQFPNLLFEACNDGGRMVDFGTAAHADYFSITDAYDPLSNRRAFFDASYVLPPAMLETYVEKWSTPNLANFRSMLRSGMMGWFSLMLDSNTWTPEQHDAARSEFALYKKRLRPLIREADLYHVSNRPDGVHWDGMEYINSSTNSGVLFAFRGSSETDASHMFKLRGLQMQRKYNVSFQDKSSPDYSAFGQELMQAGVTVRLANPTSSELVFLN